MGGLEQILDKLPGLKPEQLAAAKFDPKVFRRQIGIIDSMTPGGAAAARTSSTGRGSGGSRPVRGFRSRTSAGS